MKTTMALAGAMACLFAAAACSDTTSGDNPGGASGTMSREALLAGAPAAVSRPWKASLDFRATNVEWAGGAPMTGATSTFGGRCSVPSDYVITAAFDGEATHGGRFSGTGGHCTQLVWTPQGPGGVTYSDGRATVVSANGSRLIMSYGHGTSGVDASTGALCFQDEFTFLGGTGLFAGATGGGREGGTLTDLGAVLAGTPVPMWMEGTINYHPGN